MLSQISNYFADDWKKISFKLLEHADVKSIGSTNDPNDEKCLEMLVKWLETDTSATYSKLIDALCEHDLQDVAKKIEDKVLK